MEKINMKPEEDSKVKRCAHCHKFKPLHLFYDCNNTKDGKQSWCIECHRKYDEQRAGHVRHQGGQRDLFQEQEQNGHDDWLKEFHTTIERAEAEAELWHINETCADALNTFGYEHQEAMIIEEMSELANALMKQKRGRATKQDVITEIADVHIMLIQMQIAYGMDEVNMEIARKLKRLKETIANEKRDSED